jgi:hypothetical protein
MLQHLPSCPEFLTYIVTDNKTWVHHITPTWNTAW